MVYSAFNLFEVCCGIYYPAISAFRTLQIREESRSLYLNVIRVPMNIIVVLVLIFIKDLNYSLVFMFCGFLNALALVQFRESKPENVIKSMSQVDLMQISLDI